MLDALCLDLMGTIVYDPYLEAIEAALGMSIAQARPMRNPQSWPRFELGLIDEDEFVRTFFATDDPSLTFDIESFHRVRRAGYAFLPGMEAVLGELDGRVDRYIASNYPVWIDELHQQFAFDRHFDGVFASCRMGVRKPDPAFFHALLEAIGRRPEQCLFVDDRAVNCESAEALGMAAHLFDGADGLRRRLRAEGLLA